LDETLLSLFGLLAGLAAGLLAGKLVARVIPYAREAAPQHFAGATATLLMLAAAGLALGYFIRIFLDHWSALAGALAAFLYFITPLLKSDP